MAATFDKVQGFTFVYSNMYKMFEKAKAEQLNSALVIQNQSVRILKAEALKQHQIQEFKPKELQLKTGDKFFPAANNAEDAEKTMLRKFDVAQTLKRNLQNLHEAHNKLSFLLQELDTITKKKS